jgi:polysaccharide biosynthesis transport protein
VQHALRAAPNIYEGLIGVVLNKADLKAMGRYAGYSGEYYNESHYSHYGVKDAS